MPKLPLRLICPLVIALVASPVSADITPDTAAGKPRRASLIKRFFREFDNYDTTYVAPNRYNFTAMAQVSKSTQICRLAGYPPDGHSLSLSMSPRSSVKLGPYFGWRWLFFGYTFDVGRVGSNQTRREFNLSLYSAMLGCDFIYVRNNGGYRLKRVTGFDGIDEKAYAKRDFDGLETTPTTSSTTGVSPIPPRSAKALCNAEVPVRGKWASNTAATRYVFRPRCSHNPCSQD